MRLPPIIFHWSWSYISCHLFSIAHLSCKPQQKILKSHLIYYCLCKLNSYCWICVLPKEIFCLRLCKRITLVYFKERGENSLSMWLTEIINTASKEIYKVFTRNIATDVIQHQLSKASYRCFLVSISYNFLHKTCLND